MKIEKDKVITMAMTVKDEEGGVIEQAGEHDPFIYLHGHGNLFDTLEKALEGKTANDSLQLTVTPEDGYGERDDSLTSTLPAESFEGVDEVEVGMLFNAETDQGPLTLTVIEVAEDGITVDGNHPFAGRTLSFDIKVVGIRDATEDELSHGHAHSPTGCDHTH